MSTDFYLNCDELDLIPAINKANWLFELDYICTRLPQGAKVLQVGCMNGVRIMEILKKRSDLQFTGLDIEKKFLDIAKDNFEKAGFVVDLIEADITKFDSKEKYDYTICLNNTLGYIPDTDKAIEKMKKSAKVVIVSVYGERFNTKAAQEYFDSIGLKNFEDVKCFTKGEVSSWAGKITESPLGYICEINN